MAKRRSGPAKPSRTGGEAAEERGQPSAGGSVPIVGVGASAGGLEAFTELLRQLPLDTGFAFVLVQHLDPRHESALPLLLGRVTELPVCEVTNDLRVEADRVYVIPPNTKLSVAQGVLQLQPRPRAGGAFRSIDFFLESLALDQHERAIGVILSGTATDGTMGLEAIKAEGGITFAQDGSARYDSMPRSAVAAGCVDLVLSPPEIAREIERIARHALVLEQPAAPLAPMEHDRPLAAARPEARRARSGARREGRAGEDGSQGILNLLRNHSGVDFSLYKPSTIQRRIARRMLLSKEPTLESYARLLRGNAKELDALYSDVLLSVTSFFRNPDAFDLLQRKVLPKLFQQRGDAPLRVWVLGCSTGQEAYSIAMALAEAADKAPRPRKVQLFATDLNDALLDKARSGLYAKSLVQDIAPKRLRRFFVEEEGGYRVAKSLRESVVFAKQNLISDPPFSRMDLISCRNLLIYLDPGLQEKLLPLFHYALKPQGILFLGASESIGAFGDLFAAVDKKHKVYAKKAAPTPAFRLPVRREGGEGPALGMSRKPGPVPVAGAGRGEEGEGLHGELKAQREADRVTVNQFAPPGVLISADLQILQFRGATDSYLKPPIGKASFDLLKMAREGLVLPLRAAVNKAKREGKPALKEGVRLEENGRGRRLSVRVLPLKNLREPSYLVLFENAEGAAAPAKAPADGRSPDPAPAGRDRSPRDQQARRIAELEAELAEMRDFLESIQEQYEAANEELQASNEEVQSANEELQSINEELETSKEELESANEELTTVNDEMANRNAELSLLNGDLVNLQTSTRLAILVLRRDLTLRRFTAPAAKLFGLQAGDVGRPIGSVRHGLDVPDLEGLVAGVVATVQEHDREVRDEDGRWYSLRVRPYLTLDDKVEGAVLVLVDIDRLKRSESAATAARDYAENTVETVREPLLVLDRELRVESANRSFYGAFDLTPAETVGRLLFDLGRGQWDIPRLRELLGELLPRHTSIEAFRVEHDFAHLGRRALLLNARSIHDPQEKAERILLAIEDVTEREALADVLQRNAADLSEADRHKNEFLAILAHELRNPLAPIRSALQILRLTEGDPETVLTLSEMMERQVGQMVRLVDDLLDVSRISRGKFELCRERIELATVVQGAVETVRPLYEKLSHELTISLPSRPLYLDADPARIAQVVGNLLHNAGKYTDQGGHIALTVEREGEMAVVRVRDDGIGIAADQLPRIFDMFTQVDTSLERSFNGLGIGLTLVTSVVVAHGGTVEAHSAGLGQGSEIVVRLPLRIEPPNRPPQEQDLGEPTLASTYRILVVDDNRDAADSLAMLFNRTGSEARTAYDGLEAVEVAAQYRPEVILLDLGLPKLNGYEACRRIREQPWGKDVVLIALTGWGQEEDRRKSNEAGFDVHLVKPVGQAAIVELLAKLGAGLQEGR